VLLLLLLLLARWMQIEQLIGLLSQLELVLE
jgi:hypothetical protein